MRRITKEGNLIKDDYYKIVTEDQYIYIYIEGLSEPIYTFTADTELDSNNNLMYTGLTVYCGKYNNNNDDKLVLSRNSIPLQRIPDSGMHDTLYDEIYSAIQEYLYMSYYDIKYKENQQAMKDYVKKILNDIIE